MSVQSVALASLVATYTDSESEDDLEDDRSEYSTVPQVASSKSLEIGQRKDLGSPKLERRQSSVPSGPTLVTNAAARVQRLVSYFDDSIISEDEGARVVAEGQPTKNGDSQSTTLRSPSRGEDLVSGGETEAYDVAIPPEPDEPCPVELVEKITRLLGKMESGGLDVNKIIQQRKDFRNPSIYEKLIQFCSISELGTNYPPERFDPFKWGKDSYYEELAKAQKVDMEKLQKIRKEKLEKTRKKKPQIEIVSGTAKRTTSSKLTTEEDAKKRKSKCVQVVSGPKTTCKTSVALTQPSTTTLTTSATDKKATVISAFGSLPKKRL